ncbi:MAG: aldehyde oxidoreductase [Candidatus Pacebacteria bacterium CG10_big_fil_rev_8_21_14_0_10_44_11]|nr:MAG: aldehyde oxidoreductase [Candidatus Pacebacteria bacterium CG10_big_fil_rev_8_21_14_0_10_44_11]
MESLLLNNGKKIPKLGLGTWRSDPGQVAKAVEHALTQQGYRHIDCAAIYGNEPEIGTAFKKVFASKQIKRSDVFITSKLWNTNHHPDKVEAACSQTLQNLQLEYLDLYLIHWGIAFADTDGSEPVGKDGFEKTQPVSIQQTWQAMEQLVQKGLVKSIGVANFTAPMILDLLSYAKVKPAINQIEIHPYNSQEELIAYCQRNKIQITAYSPLGSASAGESGPLHDLVITDIAQKHKKTPAQVLIRWSIQRGLSVIPKSTHLQRVAENSQITDFKLTKKNMVQISTLNKNIRFVDPSQWWGVPYFK